MLSDTEVNLLCAEIAAEAAEETLDAENEVLWNSIVANIMAMGEMYTKEYESEWD
jgi:hypothetical protein